MNIYEEINGFTEEEKQERMLLYMTTLLEKSGKRPNLLRRLTSCYSKQIVNEAIDEWSGWIALDMRHDEYDDEVIEIYHMKFYTGETLIYMIVNSNEEICHFYMRNPSWNTWLFIFYTWIERETDIIPFQEKGVNIELKEIESLVREGLL